MVGGWWGVDVVRLSHARSTPHRPQDRTCAVCPLTALTEHSQLGTPPSIKTMRILQQRTPKFLLHSLVAKPKRNGGSRQHFCGLRSPSYLACGADDKLGERT